LEHVASVPTPPVANVAENRTARRIAAAIIYMVAFITGAIVMSFEMLGSRYLNPYFGSGIYTWASLISTVLAALTVGYFIGGWLADRRPSAPLLGVLVAIGAAYVLVLPSFAQQLLEFVLDHVDDVKTGSLLAALAIMMFPVTFLGMYSPFAIRLLLRSAASSGTVSGTVYGVSTVGSIVGTLGTTFFLLPSMGSRVLTLLLGSIGLAAGAALIGLATLRRGTMLGLVALFALLQADPAGAQDHPRPGNLIDEAVRAAMLKHRDGEIAHNETEYNDIFITKRRNELTMSFQLKGWDYTESVVNLRDPEDLVSHYTRAMTTAVAYPTQLKSLLMIGLGGGAISTYLGRALSDASIETVEIDPGVIAAAKTYFGIRETERLRYVASDGRVLLKRQSATYDLILVDAYHGGYVPFHLLTKEFYELLKQRLNPGGAVVFNVHDGTKLYVSTIKTLAAVFPTVHLYPSGAGETAIVVMAAPAPDDAALMRRAEELQKAHGFRFPLPQLLAKRAPQPALTHAELLTDDFAPVNLYDTIGRKREKKQ
jgi:spermidine synthase